MGRRFPAVLAAAVIGILGVAGTALADDRGGSEPARDHSAFCERLESKAQSLRAEIGRIESVQERIEAKLASGELNRREEARAKHALRVLEARQGALEHELARVLNLLAEKCGG